MCRHILCTFLVFCASWSTIRGTSEGIYETTSYPGPIRPYDETTSCPEIKLSRDLEVKHDASVSYEREYFEGVDMGFLDEAGVYRYLNGTKAHLCCPVGGGCYFSSSDNGPSTSLCLEGMWTREFRQCPQTEENGRFSFLALRGAPSNYT